MPDETETAIPPALTAEEWRRAAKHAAAGRRGEIDGRPAMISGFLLTGNPAAAAAIALDMLPDGDPRKITRDIARALLACADWDEQRAAKGRNDWTPEGQARLREYAAALDSILPPEP